MNRRLTTRRLSICIAVAAGLCAVVVTAADDVLIAEILLASCFGER